MVFREAIAGLGVAIAPAFLARPELVAGELVTLFDPIVQKGLAPEIKGGTPPKPRGLR